MIEPSKITNFNLSNNQLEETILWWILAAGKNGKTAARCLNSFLSKFSSLSSSPFGVVAEVDRKFDLALEMKDCGIGCYNNKADSWRHLVNSNIDLKKCSLEDLESIKGIGPKTARCFLIHSRENQNYAGLDTHVLKFLKMLGYKTPKSTPTGKKYVYLEKEFLNLVKFLGKSAAEVDLIIWNYFSSNKNKQEMLSILNLLKKKGVRLV